MGGVGGFGIIWLWIGIGHIVLENEMILEDGKYARTCGEVWHEDTHKEIREDIDDTGGLWRVPQNCVTKMDNFWGSYYMHILSADTGTMSGGGATAEGAGVDEMVVAGRTRPREGRDRDRDGDG